MIYFHHPKEGIKAGKRRKALFTARNLENKKSECPDLDTPIVLQRHLGEQILTIIDSRFN